MAFLLALLIVAITAGLVWPMASKMWWTPVLASVQGANFDKHFLTTMVMCVLIFVPAQLAGLLHRRVQGQRSGESGRLLSR